MSARPEAGSNGRSRAARRADSRIVRNERPHKDAEK
jgi:hypothetical protein